MKITKEIIEKVHQKVNERIFKDYPSLDKAGCPEGHISKWEVEYVLQSYVQLAKKE